MSNGCVGTSSGRGPGKATQKLQTLRDSILILRDQMEVLTNETDPITGILQDPPCPSPSPSKEDQLKERNSPMTNEINSLVEEVQGISRTLEIVLQRIEL